MRSPLSRGAADLFHPIRQRRGGDVNNRSDICRMERGVTNKNRKEFFFFFSFFCPFVIPEFNLIMWMCREINLTFLLCNISLSIYSTCNPIPHSSLVSCFLTSSLPFFSVILRWLALSECSTIAFIHSESLMKLQSSTCLRITWQREKATSLSLNASPIHSHDSEVVCLFPW